MWTYLQNRNRLSELREWIYGCRGGGRMGGMNLGNLGLTCTYIKPLYNMKFIVYI